MDGDAAPGLDRLEETLTAGYARALALEAESLRLGRRMGEIARVLDDDRAAADELATLARRRSAAERRLARLRGQLESLRERMSAARSALDPAL